MRSLREVMDAQDWSTWSATPACVQKLATLEAVCDNVDGAAVRLEVNMGSIGEDHVALTRRVAELEDLLHQSRTHEERMRHSLTETAKTRDEVVAAFEVQRRELKDATARAEQAERERDEALAALAEAKQAIRHQRESHKAQCAARERAEADNAALLGLVRRLMEGPSSTVSYLTIRTEAQGALASDHPGAALLDRLRLADIVRQLASHDEACQRDVTGENDPMNCAVCAYDALEKAS